MGRKKKISLKLNPEWMLNDPIDFEYNKYTLLGYLQKCEKEFEKLEIYPNFVELSLHLANVQSLGKENTLLLTNKQFESYDDEILLKDLYPKKPKELSDDELYELRQTLQFSGGKLFDAFNSAKHLWNVSYDNIDLFLKYGKKYLNNIFGFVYYQDKIKNQTYIWEYNIREEKGQINNLKIVFKKIFFSKSQDVNIIDSIYNKSKKLKDDRKDFPIFEVKPKRYFPIDQTLVPITKRKLLTYLYQQRNIVSNRV
jgi:hypothetical protein